MILETDQKQNETIYKHSVCISSVYDDYYDLCSPIITVE